MSKKKKTTSSQDKRLCECHSFKRDDDDEVVRIRDKLLKWYELNRRTLPWRTIAKDEPDPNKRGYAVWVSEIMLQQTQVATVIDYYNRWMEKWPTVHDLAEATLDEVNTMWAGLGYYSRGRRLWEGAKRVVTELQGELPRTVEKLMKELPGVGRYTSSAIASIAYGQAVGLVDGNVIRVVSRMRKIGADSTSNDVLETIWANANRLVDPQHAGDLNQSLMELGATVCTPKLPSCSKCPVADHCHALDIVKRLDLENRNKIANLKTEKDIEDCCDDCGLCFPRKCDYIPSDGVANFPRKPKKAAQHQRRSLVVVVSAGEQFCLLQRPATGLLANLFEFPSIELPEATSETAETKLTKKMVEKKLSESFDVKGAIDLQDLGEVVHQFSHIRQSYLVWCCKTASQSDVKFDAVQYQKCRWMTAEDIDSGAISTAMKKVFALIKNMNSVKAKKRRTSDEVEKPSKQRKINDFFSSKSTK